VHIFNQQEETAMLTMLRVLKQASRDQRGVVSVEWIILGAVVMAAIVAAFAPQFEGALTSAVTAIGTELQTQIGNAGGGGS
jgi:Flp pilus assembly pilin Flp